MKAPSTSQPSAKNFNYVSLAIKYIKNQKLSHTYGTFTISILSVILANHAQKSNQATKNIDQTMRSKNPISIGDSKCEFQILKLSPN